MSELKSYWWCPNCKLELCPENVTYGEQHEACGHPAEWIEPESMIVKLTAEVAELKERLEQEQGMGNKCHDTIDTLIAERDEARAMVKKACDDGWYEYKEQLTNYEPCHLAKITEAWLKEQVENDRNGNNEV